MNHIERTLRRIGGNSTNAGYRYLAYALELLLEMEEFLFRKLINEIYSKVAEKFDTTPDAVTRSIARTVEDIWVHGDKIFLQEIAGRRLVEKPLPNELIYYLVTYLKEQENAAVLAK